MRISDLVMLASHSSEVALKWVCLMVLEAMDSCDAGRVARKAVPTDTWSGHLSNFDEFV
jgi:hypothetical protein